MDPRRWTACTPKGARIVVRPDTGTRAAWASHSEGRSAESESPELPTYIQGITEALREELERDPSVFLIGEDIGTYEGAFKVTKGFLQQFGPRRILDTPISESAIVGAATGAALMGMRPVVEMQFIDFISCAWNQIVNMAAKIHYRWGRAVPITIRGPSGGYTHGGPFHSENPEAWFCHVPGLKVVAPSTGWDAKGLLKSAIRDDNPVLYLEHKFLYRRIRGPLPGPDVTVPIGVAEVKRPGADASVITYGSGVHLALEAAAALAAEGHDVEVLDLRTLRPLDRAAIVATVERTGKVLVLHEAHLTGGLGGEVAALIAEHAFERLDAPVMRLAAADTPVPYSDPLEQQVLPDTARVTSALRTLLDY
ncbi:MAG: alpha-ketoacid dehydrogenase subunit beta [Candidatus Wallbacteria bacterium]|nr:alpha-ketoacid dehydrogenase subunit beta [Candidatus Wallbacteria bacterium]